MAVVVVDTVAVGRVVGKAAAGIVAGSGSAACTRLQPQCMPYSAAVGCKGRTVAAGSLPSPEPEDIDGGIPRSVGAAAAVQDMAAVAVERPREG